MRIIKHGEVIVFKCAICGCVFSEVSGKCYSSTHNGKVNYSMMCPDCNSICWTSDELQNKSSDS